MCGEREDSAPHGALLALHGLRNLLTEAGPYPSAGGLWQPATSHEVMGPAGWDATGTVGFTNPLAPLRAVWATIR